MFEDYLSLGKLRHEKHSGCVTLVACFRALGVVSSVSLWSVMGRVADR